MNDDDKQAKLTFIEAYFGKWTKDLEKTKEILSSEDLLPQWLILMCCYIDAFSTLRYPGHDNNKAFKLLVLEYSGEKKFYSQVDLYFLYMIDKSRWAQNAPFKHLNNHEVIKESLEKNFEGVGDYHGKNRYKDSADVLDSILSSRSKGVDEQNLKCHIEDYTLASILYHVIRCSAVHEYDFPALSQYSQYLQHGNVINGYRPNHRLTPESIWETLSSILAQLRKECLDNCKWPWELSS